MMFFSNKSLFIYEKSRFVRYFFLYRVFINLKRYVSFLLFYYRFLINLIKIKKFVFFKNYGKKLDYNLKNFLLARKGDGIFISVFLYNPVTVYRRISKVDLKYYSNLGSFLNKYKKRSNLGNKYLINFFGVCLGKGFSKNRAFIKIGFRIRRERFLFYFFLGSFNFLFLDCFKYFFFYNSSKNDF